MSAVLDEPRAKVPQDEVDRLIAEFCQAMADRLANAVVVYHDPYRKCPWEDCSLKIVGIDFCLNQIVKDDELRKRMLRDWWIGHGLVARCPRCQRYVAYEVLKKRAVPFVDPSSSVLPDNWHLTSHVGIRD
jgi:hypothetical protein